jgi:hypothetical protein
MTAIIERIDIPKSVKTPLAAAIDAVADDLAAVEGRRVVVVVSDGQESCGGDPETAVRALRAKGFDVTVNIVGLGLSGKDRKRIRRLAELGGGIYFDAKGAGQLDDALRAAVSAPFDAYDRTGALVASGIVNGPPIELPPGTYRVVVRTDPEQVFQVVVIGSDGDSTLTLASSG